MKQEKVLTEKLVVELGLDKLSVITSDMLEEYTIIGDYAFEGCFTLTTITIPNSITSIENNAFRSCYSLASITIPNSVTNIGWGTFWGCSSLTSIIIPNSITSIGNYAFEDCSSLTSVIIPNSVTSIGEWAFSWCCSLTSITLSNSVTSIGNYAFYACNKLREVIIADKTYEIQEVDNGKCKAYKAFNANMSCRKFQYEEGKTYEIKGKIRLCERGFHTCLNLLDVFNYYNGKFGKDIVVHEVELEEVSNEMHEDTKVVAKKITIGKRIL